MLLIENVEHQLTVAGVNLLNEARTGNVDVTGWTLLDVPEVIVNDDGSVLVRLAVAEKKQRRVKATVAEDDGE